MVDSSHAVDGQLLSIRVSYDLRPILDGIGRRLHLILRAQLARSHEQQLSRDFHQISLGICDDSFIVAVSRDARPADNLNARLLHFFDQTIHRRARTN